MKEVQLIRKIDQGRPRSTLRAIGGRSPRRRALARDHGSSTDSLRRNGRDRPASHGHRNLRRLPPGSAEWRSRATTTGFVNERGPNMRRAPQLRRADRQESSPLRWMKQPGRRLPTNRQVPAAALPAPSVAGTATASSCDPPTPSTRPPRRTAPRVNGLAGRLSAAAHVGDPWRPPWDLQHRRIALFRQPQLHEHRRASRTSVIDLDRNEGPNR